MTTKKKRKQPPQRPVPQIDPVTVLELVKALGGYQHVAQRWAAEGILNPSTNAPYTKHSVKRYAMMAPGWKEWNASRLESIEGIGGAVEDILKKVRKEQKP